METFRRIAGALSGRWLWGAALFLLVLQANSISAQDNVTEPAVPAEEPCSPLPDPCKKGVILPLWEPTVMTEGDKAARATIYFAGLLFFFLGVSIIADRFMAAIEVITAQEREVTIKRSDGTTQVVVVKVWNETVSNLTLMALGSSAPEILLSIIEIIGNNFNAGDLGPSTIVGSAAFNLFVIIAICVQVIPDGEVRRIKHLRVFIVTASWSLFAYLWLFLILAVISPRVVDVWEGIVTLAFFPVCVLIAYVADRRLLFYKYLDKRYRASRSKKVIVASEGGDMELAEKGGEDDLADGDLPYGVGDNKREIQELLKDLRRKHPDADMDTLMEKANYELLNSGPKSRAFYRIQATRKMTGSGNVIKKGIQKDMQREASLAEIRIGHEDDSITKVYFEPDIFTVLENVGTFDVIVVRRGGDLNRPTYVDYKSEDGTANAGSDYEYVEGTLYFKPGETQKEISVTIIDDEVFEEDEHFFMKLSNVRTSPESGGANDIKLVSPAVATINILDDDHAGVFTFEDKELEVHESVGTYKLKVIRGAGARGVVRVPYRTIDGIAKGGGDDYEDAFGELEFQNDETSKEIDIIIIDDEEYEKDENFFVELGEPYKVKAEGEEGGEDEEEEVQEPTKPVEEMTEEERIKWLGRPQLGEHKKVELKIIESYEFKNAMDKLMKKTNLALVVGTSSWREQFVEAVTVSADFTCQGCNEGDDDEDEGEEGEEGEEKLPSCSDYVMHFLTLFWKVLFAFVPPTDYWGGWACFIVSIIWIGILTALIGDLASGFGCTVGLKDAVTAISFVALGTSVPDTFASKVAAVQDKYADASVGNVTGSNAVNVFLGIGVAWSIAAIKHAVEGNAFNVDPGTLGFAVTLFFIFAIVTITVLMLRRLPVVGGELGGNPKFKLPTTLLLVGMWMSYVVISAFQSYCYIPGF
ncbi:sodium/calcium exchanger 3-like isoform X1 [Branchiostoma floridae x Branchiostoma japonicum]